LGGKLRRDSLEVIYVVAMIIAINLLFCCGFTRGQGLYTPVG